jgi:hypothetical protein
MSVMEIIAGSIPDSVDFDPDIDSFPGKNVKNLNRNKEASSNAVCTLMKGREV